MIRLALFLAAVVPLFGASWEVTPEDDFRIVAFPSRPSFTIANNGEIHEIQLVARYYWDSRLSTHDLTQLQPELELVAPVGLQLSDVTVQLSAKRGVIKASSSVPGAVTINLWVWIQPYPTSPLVKYRETQITVNFTQTGLTVNQSFTAVMSQDGIVLDILGDLPSGVVVRVFGEGFEQSFPELDGDITRIASGTPGVTRLIVRGHPYPAVLAEGIYSVAVEIGGKVFLAPNALVIPAQRTLER